MADKTTELERIYTIPLRKAKELTRGRRADNAVRDVKRYLTRHMKADNVWLDHTVNEALWSNGKFAIPSRIRVKATRFSDGVVEVTLPESTATGSVRESLKERREKAASAPVLKAPEPETAAEGDGARPVTDVKGVGPATAEKLEKAGITNLQELADSDPAKVAEAASLSDDKAKSYVADAKAILAGKTEVADVKAQPALEAAKDEAEKPKAGADERKHLAAKAERDAADKAAKKDE